MQNACNRMRLSLLPPSSPFSIRLRKATSVTDRMRILADLRAANSRATIETTKGDDYKGGAKGRGGGKETKEKREKGKALRASIINGGEVKKERKERGRRREKGKRKKRKRGARRRLGASRSASSSPAAPQF